jgi:choice-of-anchor C domain-containing protein
MRVAFSRPLFVSAILALSPAVPASAASIINGGFEAASTNPGGSFATLAGGNSDITGWTVGGHSIDYIGGYWQAAEGNRSIDLAGSGIGSIAQDIATAIGQAYRVTFSVARNPDGGSNPRTGLVEIVDGTSSVISFNNASTSSAEMGWETRTFDFVATSTSSVLRFSADESSANYFGLALDNVTISDLGASPASPAVPEPDTWAMMLAGFGAVGLALRRRRNIEVNFA